MRDLSEGWERHHDEHGTAYYVETATGMSAWELPPTAGAPLTDSGEWLERHDAASGSAYYEHAASGEVCACARPRETPRRVRNGRCALGPHSE